MKSPATSSVVSDRQGTPNNAALNDDGTSSSKVITNEGSGSTHHVPTDEEAHVTEDADPSHPLFANMPALPKSRRPPDEYILVRRTGRDTIAGTVNSKLERQPTPREFNECCRLYRDGVGNYYPPPLAWDRIKVPEHERAKWLSLEQSQISTTLRKDYKLDVWHRAHAEMNVTGTRVFFDIDKSTVTDNNGRLIPEQRYVATKYGRREILKNYEHKFQAGSLLPDIMIKTPAHDIQFVHRYAGDAYMNKTFSDFERDIKERLGQNTEIKLRSKSGIMHDSKYLESWERGAADIRFAAFAGQVRTHNRELPRATVNFGRQPDEHGGLTLDHHVSVEFLFASAPNSPWAQALKRGELWDRVQVLTHDGNGYMSPWRLHYSDPTHFASLMDGVGLPKEMGEQRYKGHVKFDEFDAKPPVLLVNGPELRDAREPNMDLTDATRILIADRNAEGQRTGTYTILADYQRASKALPQDAANLLGVAQDHYSRSFIPPNPARPPIYDSREREHLSVAL
ncbi:VirE2 family protein [Bradyrhizobium sp. CCGUVB23]|uniref:VirE2 family protein n=1 Tax=Bradyrhizobium sp. CCGUVB23 TaxID=2949630 RepID=UPI0020B1D03C|nr:VirE2 family protein [Bradyrhizobium sp. CCGUVB23]MCP3468620.1 VirE2 family protein [Bradyrhizobium sp. CCGUVB23]